MIDAGSRAALDRFVRSDPYHVNGVWERVDIHGYNKKRGTPIVSRAGVLAARASTLERESLDVDRSPSAFSLRPEGARLPRDDLGQRLRFVLAARQ